MRRHRHRLDLLPLLDVFIVVLFVFATIHERKIDESTQAQQELEDRVEELEQLLVAQRRQAAEPASDAAFEALRARAERAEQRLEAPRSDTAELDASVAAQEAREADVFRKLLDHFTVFEIEIAGADAVAEVSNRCCYRIDLDARSWRSCDAVPADPEQRRAWLERGAGGLVDALRRTKGGNALTVVRQDAVATHRIGSKLGDVLREQFPGHQIYAGGVTPSGVECRSAAP
jgi:hypothetical protein